MLQTDIAIITIIPEEYAAVATRLETEGCSVAHDLISHNQPNQYAWVTGSLRSHQGLSYQLALALAGSPGPANMANAVNATIARFKPRYLLLVGIAGGFAIDGLTRGDVAISSVIYDYEYGKIATDFQPRHDNTYQVDGPLFRSAIALNARNDKWADHDLNIRPEGVAGRPKLRSGAIASGNKVVDNADYAMFSTILQSWPKLLAVEMEGAGAAATIKEAISANQNIGFLMVRGISDMPNVSGDPSCQVAPSGNTAERDTWKRYASAVAASFTIHWIKNSWPIPPVRTSNAIPPENDIADSNDDDDGTLPVIKGRKSKGKTVEIDPSSGTAESSIWHGFDRGLAPSAFQTEIARLWPEGIRSAIGNLIQKQVPTIAGNTSALDNELSLIKSHLDRYELEVAEVKLNELATRAADQLHPHQWYELKTLRSRIHSSRWEWERAGRELLDATRHMPATDRARVNEVLGYELIGEKEKAHALATALRTELPQSVRLLTIWVRTAPNDARFDYLVTEAAELAKLDEELSLTLAHRAVLENRFEEAIPFARRATELDSESPQAWFILGEAIHASGYKVGNNNSIPLLKEAVGYYDRAVKFAQKEKLTGLESAIRLNRAKVRHLIGDQSAESDYQRSIELARPDQGVRTAYAEYLLDTGRPTDALRELAQPGGEAGGDRDFIEASALYDRNQSNDRLRAVELIRSFIANGQSDRWDDAHSLLVQWSIESKSQEKARDFLALSAIKDRNPLIFHTLDGWLHSSVGNKEAARLALLRALESLSINDRKHHVYLLAQALSSVNEDALALPLFERCYKPGIFDHECRSLIKAAQRLDRHDVLSRVCRELREAGASDARIALLEIGVLQIYDPKQALHVASESLIKYPKNRHVALWQSILALRLDRADLVISELNKLPTVGEVTAQGSLLVLHILEVTKQFEPALHYAYDALRAHFDDEFVHGQYIAFFLKLNRHCPQLRVGGKAGPGMAVCYREERDETERWAVIEDSSNPDLSRDEYASSHALSVSLSGRSVGETVTISEFGIQPRTASIRQVIHKFIYRFQDCRDRYQIRFPGGTAIQMVYVGTDQFDPSPIIRGLEDQKQHIQNLDKNYRGGPMPFAMYSDIAGRDEIAAWDHLTSKPDLGIRPCNGNDRDLRIAQDFVKSCKYLVLDLTTLITIARLGLLRLISIGPRRCIVAQSVFERIQSLIKECRDSWRSTSSVVLAPDGGLAKIDVTEEEQKSESAFLETLRDAVRDGCEIRPCHDAAALAPDRRKQLVKILGRPSLDSILLSKAPNTVLWAEDLVLGLLGRTDFLIEQVWTQAVLFVVLQEQSINRQDFDFANARMIGWNFHGMKFNEDTLIAAAEIAEWRMDCWPVQSIMKPLRDPSSDNLWRLHFAAQAIKAVWRKELPQHHRHSFLYAILYGFQSERLVKRLLKIIPMVFSVDVFSSDEVTLYIEYWLQGPPRIFIP